MTHTLKVLCKLKIFSYHSCDLCKTPAVSDTTARDKEKVHALQNFGIVITVRECQWRKSGKIADESQFSSFYYDQSITVGKILAAVRDKKFFGFLNITMTAPQKVREKYDPLGFPPLFKKYMPKKEDLSENMQEFFDKEPNEQLTVGYDAKEMTLASNLVEFYIREGFHISDVHWALEYQRGNFCGSYYFVFISVFYIKDTFIYTDSICYISGRPLKKFMDMITEKRKEASAAGNTAMSTVYKLIGNSSYGRLG